MRINKFISQNTEYSRRKADELIKDGKVFVNGKITKTLGLDINPSKDTVNIGNIKIELEKNKIYLALNKPRGYITSRSDDFGRKTVMILVPKIPNLKPVGRLDYETEGLLLFSNDGDFINKHTHPHYECEKEYQAIIEGQLTQQEKNELEKGIVIDGKKTAKTKLKVLRKNEKETEIMVVVHEGRNRQIRKMFAYVKHPVKYLKRIRVGKISLGLLKRGDFRTLTLKEINA